MCFTSQPLSMNSTASQSSSSGWVGHSPCEPRSSSVRDEPLAEGELPQPVHEDARGQRVVARRSASARGRAGSPGGRRRRSGAGSAGPPARRPRPTRPASSRAAGCAPAPAPARVVTSDCGMPCSERRPSRSSAARSCAPQRQRAPGRRAGRTPAIRSLSAPGCARRAARAAIVEDLLRGFAARLGPDRPRRRSWPPCGSGRACGPGRRSGGARR